jgi:type I restriction-modification system DNA methylase subunit
MARAQDKNGNNGASLGFEAKLWAAADKLRGNMEPSDYKHAVRASSAIGASDHKFRPSPSSCIYVKRGR